MVDKLLVHLVSDVIIYIKMIIYFIILFIYKCVFVLFFLFYVTNIIDLINNNSLSKFQELLLRFVGFTLLMFFYYYY